MRGQTRSVLALSRSSFSEMRPPFDNRVLMDEAIAEKMDPKVFGRCLAGEAADRIQADSAMAADLGITGTPTFLIGSIESPGMVRVTSRLAGAGVCDATGCCRGRPVANTSKVGRKSPTVVPTLSFRGEASLRRRRLGSRLPTIRGFQRWQSIRIARQLQLFPGESSTKRLALRCLEHACQSRRLLQPGRF
jgi:hypothetical protein